MERYDSYKDSGVKWLGEIPSHWEVRRTKYLWQEKDRRSEFGSEQLLSVSQYDGVREAQSDSRSESLKGYKIVKREDLVINIMLAWLGGLGVSKHEGIVSPAYCVYKLIDVQNPRYLHYLYRTPLYLSDFARHSTGIVPSRWRMYTDDFGEVLTILPPIEEQNLMVEYLDAATSKIDEAIAQQQKMIDLLNERKQIIINNAVTKGLDPNVKMKPCGIDWIGDIPEHWEIKPLKYCARTNSGSTPRSISGKENPLSIIKWVRTTDLKNNHVSDTSEYLTPDEMKSASCPLLPKGTVLISMYGGEGSFGKLGILDVEATINQALCSMSCYGNIIPEYIFFYLQSVHPMWMKYAASTRKDPNLNQDTIRNMLVVVPPLIEQKWIIKYINDKSIKMDKVLNDYYNRISLLQERKQIIINDVVTGKVKVV